MTIYDDDNPCWPLAEELPGWEPWQEDEPERDVSGCAYCGAPDVRPDPEPFGQQPCCEGCFNLLIGGESDDPPWKCGNDPRTQ